MTTFGGSRGRVLSQQNILVSDAPVVIGSQTGGCSGRTTQVSLQRDQASGDVTQIHVTCGCGEVTILDCRYSNAGGGSSLR